MTTLLIDADTVVLASAFAVERGIRWDDDIYTLHADLNEAKDSFEGTIDGYLSAVGTEADIVLCFSCPSRRYFRHDLLPTYKANRGGSRPPLVARDLREWAQEKYESKTKPGLEADDVVGILATHPRLIPGEKIIVSADKDLQQIPGLHLDGAGGVHRIRPEYAERFLWQQVLTGDTTDNYSGCPGIGPKRAEAILASVRPDEPLWHVVLAAYLEAGLTMDDMLVQFNVARILTAEAYDFKKKEPILWLASSLTPTNPDTISSRPRRKPRSQKS